MLKWTECGEELQGVTSYNNMFDFYLEDETIFEAKFCKNLCLVCMKDNINALVGQLNFMCDEDVDSKLNVYKNPKYFS